MVRQITYPKSRLAIERILVNQLNANTDLSALNRRILTFRPE